MRYRFRGGFLAVALAAMLMAGFAQSGGQTAEAASPFKPFPCAANINWRMGNPSFTALAGARAEYGQYAGGLYRIEIPDNWNGELVLYAHGFVSATGTDGNLLRVGTPPGGWRQHLITKGYAWAASSYRCNGYVPGIGLQDTLLLTELFYNANGQKASSKTYLTGISMGGHITILGAHEFPTTFAGYLAMCPAGPGLFDYFAANGAAMEVVTGLKFSTTEPAATSLAKMLAVTGTPGSYTPAGLQMASTMINISGGPRPFALEGLPPYFAATISGAKLAGATDPFTSAFTNDNWTYSIDPGLGLAAEKLNAEARKVPANPAFRGPDGPYDELMPFDGTIQRPVLTMHGTGDMFVPIFLERELKAAVAKAGKSDLLVQRIYRIPAHCAFSDAEVISAFEGMVAWAKGGAKPAGDDVSADLANAGLQFTTPLRPGDPGTKSITPAMVEAAKTPAKVAPGPPNTGNGATPSANSGESMVLLNLAALVCLLGGGTLIVAQERRRRSRE